MIDTTQLWTVIIALGIGSYMLRFAFTGLVGNRPMPAWLLRHLRYTAVAILPALVAPQVLWPDATGGETDPARLAAAVVCFLVALWTKSMLPALFAGAVTLYGLLYLV